MVFGKCVGSVSSLSPGQAGYSEDGIPLHYACVDFVSPALAHPQATVVYAVLGTCKAHPGVRGVSPVSCHFSVTRTCAGDWQILDPELCLG